jgi:hypothetical protein
MLNVGKWSIGRSRSTDDTALKFDFNDRPSVELLLQKDAAVALAKAILEQYGAKLPALS